MQLIESIVTKKGDKLGDRRIRSVTPVSTDKIYEKVLRGPDGERPRQAEKAVALCRRAWRVVHRLYPAEFNRDVPNPWDGVTIKRRVKAKKPAVTREDVFRFANGAIKLGKPEAAAAAKSVPKRKAGWERSPYRTGLRPIIPANREKYREIYKNRPVAA